MIVSYAYSHTEAEGHLGPLDLVKNNYSRKLQCKSHESCRFHFFQYDVSTPCGQFSLYILA